jgi:hypothetical protein
VQGKRLHPDSGRGELSRGDGIELLEQAKARFDRFVRWPFEPFELARIAAPGEDVEHRPRQVDAMDLGLPMALEPIRLMPQAENGARSETRRAPRPLIRGVGGDSLGREAVDGAVRIVACHLVEAGVDDRAHARHGQGGLGQIGGQNNPPLVGRSDCRILL